ncbi:hypothetical protein LQD11_06900 [Ectothiorhodospira shaposhnikovii]|nr:hypothetical protein [Ectothiorhodospira shaposhnikovii]MCG5512857.1 hypothetical protein [Ectothiorhodospira shaposhnikovii]
MSGSAEELAAVARKMAPVDEGNLEDAIVVSEAGRGLFGGIKFEVKIDENMPLPEKPGKTVGDYATIMHEQLTPYGPLQLGPASIEKQKTTDVIVGGGFLERAADQVSPSIVRSIHDAIAKVLR